MVLNTNAKPTYNDIRILAGILAIGSDEPVHIFRTAPGVFALYAAPTAAQAAYLAADAGHVEAAWLETVRK